MEDVLGDGAHDDFSEVAGAAAAHEDPVGADFLSRLGDGLVGGAGAELGMDGDGLGHVGEVLIQHFLALEAQDLGDVAAHGDAVEGGHFLIEVHHVEQGDGGAGGLGDGGGPAAGGDGLLRAVYRDQDLFQLFVFHHYFSHSALNAVRAASFSESCSALLWNL